MSKAMGSGEGDCDGVISAGPGVLGQIDYKY